MQANNKGIYKWGFAFLLATPVFYLYGIHFFYHDAGHPPTGFIQWEHLLYMCSSKEYATGNASILYQWPFLNTYGNDNVFFQPQILVVGYLWKFTAIQPGYILTAFGLLFAVLTLRMVINIIDLVIPSPKYKNLITILFCWGGGLLSACGIVLHFVFFKGSLSTLSENIFVLDPAGGSWCLNFGRSLIYPLEAYYHFLFVSCIYLVLKRNFLGVFAIMVLLIFSHPYTAIELISIILVWLIAEYFYLKNKQIKRSHLLYVLAAFLLYFLYYGVILNSIEIYRQINNINALDWGYKAWHFVPAYAIVWLLSILSVKNIPLLKSHLSSSNNRLFLWWGVVAFLLSVHGFAIKPVQPIHFTRGYVYAGFFLFGLAALQTLIGKVLSQRLKGYILLSVLVFIFLFDNITWFGFSTERENGCGVYYSKSDREMIDFLKSKDASGIVIGNEKNYELDAGIQLYTNHKAWIPHPHLTLNMQDKRAAVKNLVEKGLIDKSWKNKEVYIYCNKNDSTLQLHKLMPVFENSGYKLYKIN